jgi:hypothetical protein
MEMISDNMNIVSLIIKLMEEVEDIVNLKGEEKKAKVLENLQTLIGKDAYTNYYFLIINVIDFAVDISKGKKLNLNNLKKMKLFSCCNI